MSSTSRVGYIDTLRLDWRHSPRGESHRETLLGLTIESAFVASFLSESAVTRWIGFLHYPLDYLVPKRISSKELAIVRRRVPQRVLNQLRTLSLFSGCTNKQLQQVAGLGTPIPVKAGEEVTVSGAPGSECFVVLSGRASCRVRDCEVATFGPGDFFGELSLIDGSNRTASVVADTPMQVLDLDRREFGRLLEVAPSVMRAMLKTLAVRLRAADMLIAQTARGSGAA